MLEPSSWTTATILFAEKLCYGPLNPCNNVGSNVVLFSQHSLSSQALLMKWQVMCQWDVSLWNACPGTSCQANSLFISLTVMSYLPLICLVKWVLGLRCRLDKRSGSCTRKYHLQPWISVLYQWLLCWEYSQHTILGMHELHFMTNSPTCLCFTWLETKATK